MTGVGLSSEPSLGLPGIIICSLGIFYAHPLDHL